jgi:hypothetical protein
LYIRVNSLSIPCTWGAALTLKQRSVVCLLGIGFKSRYHALLAFFGFPAMVYAIVNAKDRAGALTELMGSPTVGFLPFEPEPLLERGELVYRSLVAGRELGEPIPELSE